MEYRKCWECISEVEIAHSVLEYWKTGHPEEWKTFHQLNLEHGYVLEVFRSFLESLGIPTARDCEKCQERNLKKMNGEMI